MRFAGHRRAERGSGAALAPLLCALAALAAASPAAAQLGGSRDSVEADRARLSATLGSAAAADYTTYTLTLANSTVVREFVGADGTVFAVSWRGPGRPDLRQLLGDSFDRMQAGWTRLGRRNRTPLGLARSDVVIRTGGHPGVFWGAASLTAHVPADFSRSAFQ